MHHLIWTCNFYYNFQLFFRNICLYFYTCLDYLTLLIKYYCLFWKIQKVINILVEKNELEGKNDVEEQNVKRKCWIKRTHVHNFIVIDFLRPSQLFILPIHNAADFKWFSLFFSRINQVLEICHLNHQL